MENALYPKLNINFTDYLLQKYCTTVTKSAKSEIQKITSELRSNARRMFRQLVSSEVGGRLDWVSAS